MADSHCLFAVSPETGLSVVWLDSTRICREAQFLHRLGRTSCIALSRQLTSTALVALSQKKPRHMSIQVVCNGKLGQIFCDINEDCHLRGYVKEPKIDLPLANDASPRAQEISPVVGDGKLSVIRSLENGEFNQGTIELESGEIDGDVENFLSRSVQIPSVLRCENFFDGDDTLKRSVGVLFQGLPEKRESLLNEIRQRVNQGELRQLVENSSLFDLEALKQFVPDLKPTHESIPVQWKCRCSYAGVLSALQMLGSVDLAEMIDEKKPATVDCEFCGKSWMVEPSEIERVFLSTIKDAN
jgi:molecular chaperone Hsp33